MKIETIRTGWFKQKWTFRIRADNGRIIVPVEHYNNLQDMADTITALQKGLPTAEVVTIYKDKK